MAEAVVIGVIAVVFYFIGYYTGFNNSKKESIKAWGEYIIEKGKKEGENEE